MSHLLRALGVDNMTTTIYTIDLHTSFTDISSYIPSYDLISNTFSSGKYTAVILTNYCV